VSLAWPPCISPAARPPRNRLLPNGFTTRDLRIHLVPLLARHINDFLTDLANASASGHGL
jgi:hypothetical protein